MEDLRSAAADWWSRLSFIRKWELIVENKIHIADYPDRALDTLNGREIELIYKRYLTR